MINHAVAGSKVSPDTINPVLEGMNEDGVRETVSLATVARRPTVGLRTLLDVGTTLPPTLLDEHTDAVHRVETATRYSGYIEKQVREVERFREVESKLIPQGFDYLRVNSLSTEAREKLMRIQPASLGQASRIPGVSASDISILALYLR
jgi:tRNA uridine 5-carboxymethylaminomethyl modification enzyme